MFSVTRRWLHQFNAIGINGLGNRPGCGRKQRITEAERSRIIALPYKVFGGLIHEYAQVAKDDMVFGTHRAAHAAPRRAIVPSVTFSGHGRYRLGRSRGLR